MNHKLRVLTVLTFVFEVMIYDHALNADEIERLATVGLPVESAGKLAITWASLKRN